MHRDLKPENLMLNIKNKFSSVKIVDFGLASLIDVDKYLFGRCGTTGFAAPEVLNYKHGKKYTAKCDIFSIGVIFYILYHFLILINIKDLKVTLHSRVKTIRKFLR